MSESNVQLLDAGFPCWKNARAALRTASERMESEGGQGVIGAVVFLVHEAPAGEPRTAEILDIYMGGVGKIRESLGLVEAGKLAMLKSAGFLAGADVF